MSAPDRPTREQVDAAPARYSRALVDEALVHADDLADWSAKVDRQVLAAEVRALRAELERHAAEAHRYAGLASRLNDDLDEARAALAASTPQPAEPVIYRCDQSNHPSVPCSRCEVVTPAPLPAVPDGEARDRLLRHYLGKAAARLDLPDQARRVTPTADVDEIESVGEAVLAELERLRDGSPQPEDARNVVLRLYAAAAALSDAEPMSCAGGDLFGIAVALDHMAVDVRAAVAAALARPTERDR